EGGLHTTCLSVLDALDVVKSTVRCEFCLRAPIGFCLDGPEVLPHPCDHRPQPMRLLPRAVGLSRHNALVAIVHHRKAVEALHHPVRGRHLRPVRIGDMHFGSLPDRPTFFGVLARNALIFSLFLRSLSSFFCSGSLSAPPGARPSRLRWRRTLLPAAFSHFSCCSLRASCVPLHCLEAWEGSLQPSLAKCSLPSSPSASQYKSTSQNSAMLS